MGVAAAFLSAVVLAVISIASGDAETTCKEPQPPIHGTVKLHGDLKAGSLATYSCDPDRRLHGSTTTKCLESGEWTFEAPECLRSCQVPFVEKGEMGRFETRYSAWGNRKEFKKILAGENVDSLQTLIFRCKKNAFPVDNSQLLTANSLEVTCNDGIWSKELQCRQTHCTGEPPPSKNARPVISSREHGYQIYYFCTNRNVKKIAGNVTCHLGSWIGIPPKCVDQEACYTKDINYPGLVKPAEEHFNSFEYFDILCEEGYRKQTRVQKITCKRGQWEVTQNPCKFDEEDKRISSTEPGENTFSSVTQPSVNGKTSTHPTSERNEECFCTYEFHDPLVKAQIGERTLKIGDTIRLNERVSFECTFPCTILTWQNGLRFHGKVHMICNTCKKWQIQDVPICKSFEKSDTIISFDEDLNVLPGGITSVQKGKEHQFSCSSSLVYPDWDYGLRKGVSVTSTPVSGRGTSYYVTYLDFNKEVDEFNGTYECYVRDHIGRLGSTFLHLQFNDTDTCCPLIDESGIFTLHYSNQRRINSTVTFFCKGSRMRIEGRNTLTCLPNRKWSGDSPKCVDYNSCPEFLNSPELKITYSWGLSVGSLAVFECLLPNKSLSGSQSSLCQTNGSWSNPSPICEDYISCPEFPISSEMIVTYSDGLSVSSMAVFECFLPNKYLSGSHSTICLKNGRWSNPSPICEDSTCSIHNLTMSVPETVEPDMSNVTGENVPFGSEVKLKCTENFVLTGDSKAQCAEKRKWKLGKFQCVRGCFLNLNPSSHLSVEPKRDVYRTGDSITLSCPPGEETSNNVDRMMCMFNGWSDALPECVPKVEEKAPPTSGITNTNFTHGMQGCPLNLDPASHLIVEPKKDVYRTGDSITLSCPPGEKTSNNVQRIMCMFRGWSETLPECVQKVEERPRSTWRI